VPLIEVAPQRRSVAKSHGRQGSLFFKEIGKVSNFFEPQGISDLGDIPVGLTQEDLGFLENPAGNQTGGGFAGIFLQNFVQVVDVDGKAVGIIFGGPEAEALTGRFDRELAFEQLDKQGAHAGAGVVSGMQGGRGLELLAKVDQFQQVIAEEVVFEGIVGGKLPVHFLEERVEFCGFGIRELKNRIAAGPKYRQLIDVDARLTLMQEFFGKDAEITRLVFIKGDIVIGHFRCCEKQSVLFNVNDLVGIFGTVAAADEADLIVGTAVIGHDPFFPYLRHVGYPENIEMANFARNTVREQVAEAVGRVGVNFFIEVFEGGDGHTRWFVKIKGTKYAKSRIPGNK